MPARKHDVCTIEGCLRRHKALGFCNLHYDRYRKSGDPMVVKFVPQPAPEECTVSGCEGKPIAKGFCGKHYSKWQKYGDPTGGSFEWSDDRKEWHVAHNGYVVRYNPESIHAISNGYEYQHRNVIGEKIGRRLLPGETVHHVNGDKADNRIENLQMWASTHPAGQRIEDLVDWAREILSRYAEAVDALRK